MNAKNTAARAKKIKILLMDVDGVLTDGKMYYLPGHTGKMVEFKAFHALDGIGLRLLNQFGLPTGVITGRESPGTEERARNLGMSYAYQGFLSKLAPLLEILKLTGLKEENVGYIGDDWTDIPVLRRAGLACAPSNAMPEVKRVSHIVTKKAGGEGAVREVCDLILKSQGHWKKMMQYVETSSWPSPAKPPMKVVLKSKIKYALMICVLAAVAVPQARAVQDDDLNEPALSTDAARADYASEEDEALGYIQESDEDLAGFVQDYVQKDTALKGAFFLEDPASGRILKLTLDAAPKRSPGGSDNSKVLEAAFNGPGGQKYQVLFHIRSAGFGGIDIFKIELRKPVKIKSPAQTKSKKKT
ncbi:MAG: hypothetical protein A2X28_00595 [Elusimicrobia bacterium GWA2_56_46]|jgi:3-deoxy-D-manno-octulosonate 8-phosphate phosphatase (KDO 8-P phosphatase)|nr:MAG: hypothetical protein A2X28_00595 [Elusimicrobia bacterium GWA2_56_46]OGR55866.1 MAG: hypothetical protein A2X39_05970 [Elusimicrobia bacterium GWC2_56_31]HBB65976.1 hypothetical protein [Elusimicrobiota bacterium]HBW22201.1 hypothetical protein [Elusimicrobiota bacterium]